MKDSLFKNYWGLLLSIFIVFIISESAFPQDTTKVDSDTLELKPKLSAEEKPVEQSAEDVVIGEIELMEITIEAVVEKPRVSILPKRIDPDLGEMEFIDRSFEEELKKGPDKPFLIEKRTQEPIKINNLKDKLKEKDNK